jgi:hypothetical protein
MGWRSFIIWLVVYEIITYIMYSCAFNAERCASSASVKDIKLPLIESIDEQKNVDSYKRIIGKIGSIKAIKTLIVQQEEKKQKQSSNMEMFMAFIFINVISLEIMARTFSAKPPWWIYIIILVVHSGTLLITSYTCPRFIPYIFPLPILPENAERLERYSEFSRNENDVESCLSRAIKTWFDYYGLYRNAITRSNITKAVTYSVNILILVVIYIFGFTR